jgi:hypothetical protein
MDKNVLVSEGQNLVRWLDKGKLKPRGAVWVYSSDTDSWRLWIIPSKEIIDKIEFYRLVAETITAHREDMQSLDVGIVEMKLDNDPAVRGLSQLLRMEGLGSAHFQNNRFNGTFLPDGVILRMAV